MVIERRKRYEETIIMNKPCKSFVVQTFILSSSLYISLTSLIRATKDEIESSFFKCTSLFGLFFIVIAVTSLIYIFKLILEEHMQNRE